MEKSKDWSLQLPWNKALITQREDRRIEKRDFVYTSEIGKNFYEVYLQMNAVPPTNLATDVARRKMEAGNFYESIVVFVLQKVGILKDTQIKVRSLTNPKLLNVYGRADILAGHDGDWKKTKVDVEDYFKRLYENFPDFPFAGVVRKLSLETIEFLSAMYPHGLETKFYEVKSINSLAFWRNDEPISQPYEHHQRQLDFYQLYNDLNIPMGSFLYIDRDTMSLSEIPNFPNEKSKQKIEDWLEKMTYYVRNQIEPPQPEIIIWDVKEKKWAFNWEIDRSQYKDKILGGKSQKEYMIEINRRNKELRTTGKMNDALAGSKDRGTGKYNRALELLTLGASDEEVIRKSKITENELKYLKNNTSMSKPAPVV